MKTMRERGATHIAAIMSGNFTQRGEPAIVDKYSRTRAALENGADLVLLLPVTYSTASAEQYAFGGVCLANAMGLGGTLFFGSECGDMEKLGKICAAADTIEFKAWLAGYLSSNESYARARELSVEKVLGREYADIICLPNNLLAVKYIKAIHELKSSLVPETVKRSGVSHDSCVFEGGIASASFIRSLISSGYDFKKLVPEESYRTIRDAVRKRSAPVKLSDFEKLIIYRLRTMSESDYKNLPNISEGIENRLRNAALSSTSLEELFNKIKTKRYPSSRLRRLIIRALLNLSEEDCAAMPQYIRVLGFNNRGRELLHEMREKAKLPIVMKARDIKELGFEARRQFECESTADDIYALAQPQTGKFGRSFTENIIITK